MARGDSILTPISLDDDDEPQPETFRLPTVRRQERPRIDQDGIEVQERQTEWEQAAAQKERRRQMVLLALNRASTHASSSRNTGTPRGRGRERSPSPKATYVIELTDEDEPEVPQQPAVVEDVQSELPEVKILPGDPGIPSNLDPPESSTQAVSANIGLPLPGIQTTAPLPAPRQPTPSASETPAQKPEAAKIAQASPVRTEVVAATHMMPRDETSSAASVRDSESTLPVVPPPILHMPSEPIQTIETAQKIAPGQPDENAPPAAVTEPGKPTLNNVAFDSLSPIGGSPDNNRERATPSRVNTSPERGGALVVNNIDAEASEPTNAYDSQAAGSELTPTKRKVIKSVKRTSSAQRSNMGVTSSRLPDSSPNENLTNDPFLAHVHDDHAQAPLRQRSPSQSRDPLVCCSSNNITNVEFSLIEREESRGSAPEQPPEILQEELRSDGVNHTSHPPSDTSTKRSNEPPVDVPPDNLLPDNTKSADDGVTDDQTDGQTKLAVANFAEDELEATRSAIDACLKRHIGGRHETHAYLTWSRMMRQRTYQEQELRARSRKQKRLVHSSLPERYEQQLSPFADMRTIQLPFKGINTKRLPDMSQEIYVKAKPKDIVIKSVLAAPTTKYRSDAVTIPPFKEYVSLENNILADNESKLLATPYFQDEDYTCRETLLSTLPYIYELTHDENGPLDLRKEQCRFYKDTIEAFLNEMGVSWNEILYWLLAPEQAIVRINNTLPASASFRASLSERSGYHIEEFERDGQPKKAILFNRSDRKWRKFLLQLGEPTAKALRIAAIACATVRQECDFSIWYLAQRSEVMQQYINKKTAKGQTAETFTYRHAMCRVCYQHNCLLHGELREVPEDSWKTDSDEERLTPVTDEASRRSSVDKSSRRRSQLHEDDVVEDEQEDDGAPLPAHFHDDSDIEKVINYKLPVNPDAFTVCPESEMIACKGAKPPLGKFNSNWWLQQEITSHWEKRKPFFPCNHDGSCESAKCRCYREGINCEKTCKCSQLCNKRFPGCTCSRGPVKRACVSSACLCIKFNRECDADLCGSCGATEVLDPVNRYDEDLAKKSCGNVAIQRGVPRKTLLGHSEVHGFGLYMGEDIKSGEYIGEYTGEAISVNEGDRRVTIYDYQKTMYLFRLNSKQEVDATYMGNKLRFINNADDKYTNCFPKNMLCNTVFRIALFAITDIKAGTELYFNYNYPKEKTAQFKQPGGKAYNVKQTKSKTKKRESLASLSQSIEDRSRTLAATAKARAAKAAKQAAKRRGEESTEPTSRLRSGPLQARKAATGKPGRKKVTKPRGKGKNNIDSDADMGSEADGEDNALFDLQNSQATREIHDTDVEDEEFVLQTSQEDVNLTTSDAEDAEDTATEDVEDTLPGRRSGRTRNRVSNITPVVAVKKKKGKARPAAGKKKRKRPIVANSDDEE
ncbi:protein containing SET domain protein [Pyrenophora tritici-repentis]|nr:protein containing SET domain protein [Pyrenophora tritici-repentis]PZD02276.1 protein containing SET domain protein [Pyrenophora tritici-repentis]